MDAIAGPTFQFKAGTLPTTAELLAKYKFPTGPLSPWSPLSGNLPVGPGTLGASPTSLSESIRRSMPATRAALGLPPLPPLPPATARAPANPDAVTIPAILRARKVHVFPATVAPRNPGGEKLRRAFRAFLDLITPHLGPTTNIAVKSIWLAADTVSAVNTYQDPTSSRFDRVARTGEVAYDTTALLAAILGSPHLENAATALNYGMVVGERLHTGQFTFSQSDLVTFSNQPGSEEAASILKLSEALLPTGFA